ncbi:MAG: DUF885 domain-containing protein [Proteobacteria bacterium]|nr:DUF885 domain-containing protein [Pseudomonadota bacterium]
MRQARLALIGGFALLLALAPAPSRAAGPAPGVALAVLFEDYWQEHLKLHPLEATFLGDHRYDAELPNDLSTAHLGLELELERRYLKRLATVDARALEGQDRLSYEVFKRDRELALEGFRFQAELLPLNQFGSLPQTIAQLGAGTGAQPFQTPRDYDNWLKRLAAFVVWTDQAIVNMRRGSARGYVLPRAVIDRLLPQLEQLISDDPQKSLFLRPVAQFPKGVPAAEQPRLRAAYLAAVGDSLNPALRRLRDFVRDEYRPRARASVAWTDLPLGHEWYAYRVRAATTTGLGPDEIHATGLAEVARIGAEMDRVIEGLGFKGDRRAFLDALRSDPRFYFEREEDLIGAYAALKSRVRARLPELFDVAPKADFEIRPVEAFRAPAAATASYQSPAADGSRPGVFYVNTYDLKSRPKYGMEEVYLHEAEPGHHFQLAIQQELTALPSFRRFGGYGAYIEGWGLYAESLGHDLGLYTDPYSHFGALSGEIWRAIRLVVDTGMHAKGWSRERALEYLLANSAVGATDAAAEIDRYIAIPGQALTYKIGELRIQALRARAQRELGPRFDLRAFHRAVLGDGALPLDVLEAKIDRWLAAERRSP